MPRCTSCNPTCQKCHRKPTFVLPQKCPVCGRYNPAHYEKCLKCGEPVVVPEDQKNYLSADTMKNCFQCDPLKQPMCGDCLKIGRIKRCKSCKAFKLGNRPYCKYCGEPL